jgi:hypothetical protein
MSLLKSVFTNNIVFKTIGILIFTCLITGCDRIDIELTSTAPITSTDSQHLLKKTQILSYLNWMSTSDSVLVGQNIGHADGSLNYGHYLHLTTPPAVLSVDLGYDDYNRNYSDLISFIQNHYQNNGIVTVSFHMPNPYNRRDVRNNSKFKYSLLYTQGNSTNKNLKTILNNIGNFLQALKNKDIIVIVRMYPEMNGGWFWWGNNKNWPSQDEFKNLWNYSHQYLVEERKLDNLLFVYCANYQYSSDLKAVDYFYPGDEMVDLVGLDYYNDDFNNLNQNNSYTTLSNINKPLVICEIGPQSSNGNFNNLNYLELLKYPKIAYFSAWHSWKNDKWAIEDNLNMSLLMSNDKIITRNKIKF